MGSCTHPLHIPDLAMKNLDGFHRQLNTYIAPRRLLCSAIMRLEASVVIDGNHVRHDRKMQHPWGNSAKQNSLGGQSRLGGVFSCFGNET